jgi:hypothetical protein
MASHIDNVCREVPPKQCGPPGRRSVAGRVARAVGPLAVAAVGLYMSAIRAPVVWGQSPEESDQQREYNIKLAYLCSFARYVTEDTAATERPDGEWIIGVLGEDPLRGALDRIAASGRKVAGRTIAARHFASLNDYKRCHVLFIPKTAPRKQQEAAIRAMRGKPVLLVGEITDFAAMGGCVNFYLDEDNVRFEINLAALKEQHLEASSKLLALAKIVKRP